MCSKSLTLKKIYIYNPGEKIIAARITCSDQPPADSQCPMLPILIWCPLSADILCIDWAADCEPDNSCALVCGIVFAHTFLLVPGTRELKCMTVISTAKNYSRPSLHDVKEMLHFACTHSSQCSCRAGRESSEQTAVTQVQPTNPTPLYAGTRA